MAVWGLLSLKRLSVNLKLMQPKVFDMKWLRWEKL